MAAELRSVQKLLKKTMKTAKPTSTRGEPEKETTPPPPPLPGSQEGEALEETDAPKEVETPEAGLEKGKEKESGPPKKPPKKMAQASNPVNNSSSSSSSSDSDNTGDGTIESLLRHRRQERLRKKGKEAFMMEDFGDVMRDKKERKLQIPKPYEYNGYVESNPTYHRWYETINDYLYHNRGSWQGDSDRIRVVGSFMKGKARNRYDNRASQLRSNRKIDSWSVFVSALDERFTTSYKGDLAYAEIQRVKYQGSVMTNVDKLIGLNERANQSGHAWHTVLVNSLPHELRKDFAELRGGKPKEDDALLLAINEVGLTHEEFHRDETLMDKRPWATPSGKGKGNGKRKREPEKGNATAKEDSAPAGKKAKKAAAAGSGYGQP